MTEQDEQKKTEETTTENTEGDNDEGDKYEGVTLIDDANAAAERLEEANKKQEMLLKKQEAILARQALGGQTEAGQSPEKKEETDKEYSDRIDQEIREGKYNG